MSNDSQSGIKNFIRSGQFSRRFNLSGRHNAQVATLSTISSVGSVEDEGNGTDIEDNPQDHSNNSKPKDLTVDTASEVTEHPTSIAQRSLFGSVPSLISSISRRSTASRSNRSSASSRISGASSVGLPTIDEAPPVPVIVNSEYPPNEVVATKTPSHPQGLAIPFIPPPNFDHITQITPDAQSLGSTAVQTPPRSGEGLLTPSASPHYSQSPLPSKSVGSSTSLPQSNTSSPPLGSWPLRSDSKSDMKSEKSENAPWDGSPPPPFSPMHSRHNSSQFSSNYMSNQPGSRFSWQLSKVEVAQNWFTRWFVDHWVGEILCLVLSAGCMAIILGVLVHYNGKELPKWKVGVTLNAFISIFSGFAKAALLLPTAEALGQNKWQWFSKNPRRLMDFETIDAASRGPWGSFVLLMRTKGVTLYSVGAAVILLSLPLDLFYQQIVAYPTAWTMDSRNASVARSLSYAPPVAISSFNGSTLLEPDVDMQSFGFSYFTNNVPIPLLMSAECPTSNCTWEPLDTLGICGSCVKDPSIVQFGCQRALGDWKGNIMADTSSIAKVSNVSTCGYYLTPLNKPPMLMTGYELSNTSSPGEALIARLTPVTEIYNHTVLTSGGTYNFHNIQNPILDFVSAGVPGGVAGAYRNETPIVHECVLYWCIKTIQPSVLYGGYSEKVLKTRQLNTNDVDNPWTMTSPQRYLPFFNLTLPDTSSSTGYSSFSVSNISTRAAYIGLTTYIPSTWVAQSANSSLRYKYGWRITPPIVQGSLLPVWSTSGVPDHVTSLANTLSTMARTTANDGEPKLKIVNGTAWNQQTQVQLRWQWISLPAALLLFSLAFLVSTIWRSRKEEKIGVWKNSALAVLYNGLGEEIQDTAGDRVTVGNARSRAKRLVVRLDD